MRGRRFVGIEFVLSKESAPPGLFTILKRNRTSPTQGERSVLVQLSQLLRC